MFLKVLLPLTTAIGLLAVCEQAPARQDPPAALQAAAKAARGGDYEQAIDILRKQLNTTPNQPRLWLDLGNYQFIHGDIAGAIASYDEIIKVDPASQPYLWQRGLALYYAGRFREGREQFETHQNVNSADVENSVWHLLCAARQSDVATARQSMIPIKGDGRVPMAEVFQMFAGQMKPADVLAAARGNLKDDDSRLRRYEYYAYLYIGLFHEMNGNRDACLAAMKEAAARNPYAGDTLMGQIANIHLDQRSRKNESSDGKTDGETTKKNTRL